jgi:hypothetical protein
MAGVQLERNEGWTVDMSQVRRGEADLVRGVWVSLGVEQQPGHVEVSAHGGHDQARVSGLKGSEGAAAGRRERAA